MKRPGLLLLMALLLAILPGCASRKRVTVTSAPPAPTTNDQVGVMYPAPVAKVPETAPVPAPTPAQPTETAPPQPPPQPKTSTRRRNPAAKPKPSAAKAMPPATAPADAATTAPPSGTTGAPVQQASSAEPSRVSPIGQLSSGAGTGGSQKRQETSDSINSTEQGLSRIKRTLSAQEQDVATQIRTYLKQSRHALTVDDIDGASTLATKAKVLLEELAKP